MCLRQQSLTLMLLSLVAYCSSTKTLQKMFKMQTLSFLHTLSSAGSITQALSVAFLDYGHMWKCNLILFTSFWKRTHHENEFLRLWCNDSSKSRMLFAWMSLTFCWVLWIEKCEPIVASFSGRWFMQSQHVLNSNKCIVILRSFFFKRIIWNSMWPKDLFSLET